LWKTSSSKKHQGITMPLYDNLKVRPCNILGFLHFEVYNGNITLGAFAYESDALLFKEAARLTRKGIAMDELDQELLDAIEASIAGTMIKPQWVFDHIISTIRKYASQQCVEWTV
jgi:hypothetical protein